MEKIQRCAAKHILHDFTLDYMSGLILLQLFPLMMTYEINDLVFFLKCLKSPKKSLILLTLLLSPLHLLIPLPVHENTYLNNNTSHHFFFSRLPQLWNCLPPLDCSLPLPVVSSKYKIIFWLHFLQYFDPSNPCTFHMVCPCSKCLNYKPALNFVPLCLPCLSA